MYNTARGVARNANSGGQKEAVPQPIPSRQELGRNNKNASELGARGERPARPCAENASPNPRQRGGQATLTLFGCGPSITGRPIRSFQALAEDQARKVGGLTFRQRSARIQAWTAFGASCPAAPASAIPTARPVLSMEELMAKYRRPSKAEEPEPATAKTTPVMLAAAYARDMREAFPFYYDDQEHAGFQPPAPMNTLIPIIQRVGHSAVSARELYRFLELRPGDFARWCETNIAANPYAVENEDWTVLRIVAENPQGGRPSQDYALSLPLAKKLAMMSKSERGEQARDYFLECERRTQASARDMDLGDPLNTARRLLDTTTLYIEAETARREAERQIEIQAPAVAFARKVEFSPVDINIGTFAKAIGWGPNRLHAELRRRGFLFRRDGHPVPKQRFVEAGLFTVKEVPKGDRVFPVTSITGKGQLRIAHELGVTPQLALHQPAGTDRSNATKEEA